MVFIFFFVFPTREKAFWLVGINKVVDSVFLINNEICFPFTVLLHILGLSSF
jgi:hypothetical protein